MDKDNLNWKKVFKKILGPSSHEQSEHIKTASNYETVRGEHNKSNGEPADKYFDKNPPFNIEEKREISGLEKLLRENLTLSSNGRGDLCNINDSASNNKTVLAKYDNRKPTDHYFNKNEFFDREGRKKMPTMGSFKTYTPQVSESGKSPEWDKVFKYVLGNKEHHSSLLKNPCEEPNTPDLEVEQINELQEHRLYSFLKNPDEESDTSDLEMAQIKEREMSDDEREIRDYLEYSRKFKLPYRNFNMNSYEGEGINSSKFGKERENIKQIKHNLKINPKYADIFIWDDKPPPPCPIKAWKPRKKSSFNDEKKKKKALTPSKRLNEYIDNINREDIMNVPFVLSTEIWDNEFNSLKEEKEKRRRYKKYISNKKKVFIPNKHVSRYVGNINREDTLNNPIVPSTETWDNEFNSLNAEKEKKRGYKKEVLIPEKHLSGYVGNIKPLTKEDILNDPIIPLTETWDDELFF